MCVCVSVCFCGNVEGNIFVEGLFSWVYSWLSDITLIFKEVIILIDNGKEANIEMCPHGILKGVCLSSHVNAKTI